MEKTLVLIKPDAFKGHHTGDIIKLYEEKGLHLLAMRLMKMTKEVAAKHYEEHIGRPYYKELETFMLSGPIVAMVLAGDDAIQKVRDLNGKTDPKEAAPGTIRQLYAASKGENAVHASDSPESAAREIHIFFNETEIFD
ncbi:MAG: nucleoside-diphosphate kinase [Negativicutes bacterium]|jgi:Nucleoside diphosphate kinase